MHDAHRAAKRNASRFIAFRKRGGSSEEWDWG